MTPQSADGIINSKMKIIENLFIRFFHTTVFFSLFCFFSCVNNENISILSNIENIIKANPDSAYFLLADVDTSRFNTEEVNYFRLLEVMAKDKSDRDITKDQIHDLINYYESIGEFDKAALCSFYSGRIYQDNGDNKAALRSYYYVQLLTDKLSDKEIVGKSMINAGIINYEQDIYLEAISDLKKSLQYIPKLEKYYPSILLDIGNSYLLLFYENENLKFIDSAKYYHNKALDVAKNVDITHLNNIMRDIGLFYYVTGDYDMSLNYYNEALLLTTDSIFISQLYLNICWVYLEKEEWAPIDDYIKSAQRFLSDHPDELLNVYKFLYHYNERKDNQKEVFEYYSLYTTLLINIKDKNKDAALIEVRKKYKEQIMEINIEKQRLKYSLIITIIFVIVGIIFIIFANLLHTKNKKISEVYKKIKYLEKISEKHIESLKIKNSNEEQYKDILSDYLMVMKSIVLQEDVLRKEEKDKIISRVYKIIYNDVNFNWDKLYVALNIMNKELFDKLIFLFNKNAELEPLDFKICCLSISDFTQNEICILLKEPLRKTQRRITYIRTILKIEKGNSIKKHIELLK